MPEYNSIYYIDIVLMDFMSAVCTICTSSSCSYICCSLSMTYINTNYFTILLRLHCAILPRPKLQVDTNYLLFIISDYVHSNKKLFRCNILMLIIMVIHGMMIVIMVLVPQCITKSHISYKHQQEQYTLCIFSCVGSNQDRN